MQKPFLSYFLIFLTLLTGCNERHTSTDVAIDRLEALLPELIERVKQEYIEPVSTDVLLDGALNGMLSKLDPYSSYLSQQEYQSLTDTAKGEFGGIGLEILVLQGHIKIISAIDDTPAQKSGLKSDDLITHINDQEVQKLTSLEVLKHLQGDIGTTVKLKILRQNTEPFDVVITRAMIHVNPVKFSLQNQIGYLRLSLFNEQASRRMRDILETIDKTHLKGLILDLRNNPGGTLEQAVDVANLFIESGVIVDIKSRNPQYEQTLKATGKDELKGIPMVVLINKGSASASEIVAGALKDHKRAIVMGTPSFGKGSIQSVFALPGLGGIRLTTARFYTPKGHVIHEKGITPDIVVEAPSSQTPQSTEDDQRQRAIDLLSGLSVFQTRSSQ